MLRLRALFERGRRAEAVDLALPGPQGLDLLDPGFIRNPYPFYAYLREHEPVHRTKSGGWLLTRYDDVVAALSHPKLRNTPSSRSPLHQRNAATSSAAQVAQNILPFQDKPLHVRNRRLIGSVWRRMLRERTPDITGYAQFLLQSLGRSFDVCEDYARPLSIWTMSQLLGLPGPDEPQLAEWSERFFYLFAPFADLEALELTNVALADFRAYLLERLRDGDGAAGEDLLSALRLARDDEGSLSDLEIVDTAMLLFADGVGNVDRAFANLLLAILSEPSSQSVLRAGAIPLARAVEEGLRFDSPAQIISRVADEDITLFGTVIRRDATVFLGLGSANRDERRYDDPERFRLDRTGDAGGLPFGLGRHSCLGAPLVHQQLVAALERLLTDTEHLQLASRTLEWEQRFGHRWLKRLDIKCRPR